MTTRYESGFRNLRAAGKKAFIPYTVLGYPDPGTSFEIIKQMIGCDAAALELGFSFSDPLADGPIIQKAVHETLLSGFTVDDGFELLKKVRLADQAIPIGILVYFNLVLARGIDRFFARAKESGVDGVLIPDLPPESCEEVVPAARKHGIDLVFLISPLTGNARLDLILSYARGFLYLVSRLGVTGTHSRSSESDRKLLQLIQQVKTKTDLPICAGFGISSPTDAKVMLSLGCDGVITGSRVVELLQNGGYPSGALPDFYKQMVQACDHSRGMAMPCP